MVQRMLRLPAVLALRGVSRAQHYADIAAGKFPPPVKLGLRAVGWPESDIEAEQQEKIAERDRRAGAKAA